MRDLNEFRDEVYRRAEKQRKRERHRLSAALGCVALLLVAGVGLHSLSPLSVKDTADKSHGTTDDILTEEHSVQNIYGSMDLWYSYNNFFEIEAAEDEMPAVFIFDNYDDALSFFTEQSGETAATFRKLGYTNKYFKSYNIAFIMCYGYTDSGYTAVCFGSDDELSFMLNEVRLTNPSNMKYLLIPTYCPKSDGLPYMLMHNLRIYDELPCYEWSYFDDVPY